MIWRACLVQHQGELLLDALAARLLQQPCPSKNPQSQVSIDYMSTWILLLMI
jgi:hypothetical protein